MNKHKILVIGANGMLGASIYRYYNSKNEYEVLGTVRSDVIKTNLNELGFTQIVSDIDVRNENSISELISQFKPNFVFNCVGIIKQLADSKKPILAIKINALFPHELAAICTANKSKLIHFSTDCVFSGDKGNYKEIENPDALDLYGRSKFLGEVDYDGHITLRTSIIGHEINTQHSLVDWFLAQNNRVDGYLNAIFSGMPTCYIAELVEKYVITNASLSGLYHLSVEPIDKLSLLELIRDTYEKEITIDPHKDLVIDRSLDSDKFRKATGFIPLPWTQLIRKMNDEYNQYFK
ncbi:dTDP-4-dehydrorhamnose reductase family protein [Rahnella bruchi]|uniref:dTDP-4-dehydrorhamnose reductase family protein n=1 Tax=Rahnella bruchi TaxID=1510573 RepID=UPI000EA18A8C|nr:SDR family oxidoreductase [Rahnella bruchi]